MSETKVVFDKTPEILEQIKQIEGAGVAIGIHANSRDYEDGTSILMVATVNEFGSVKAKIPERSYLRSAFDENIQQGHEMMRKGIDDIVQGKTTVRKVLNGVGVFAREVTKTKMETIKEPKNSDVTIDGSKNGFIKGKGFNNPLIHTRHLKNSIGYRTTKGK